MPSPQDSRPSTSSSTYSQPAVREFSYRDPNANGYTVDVKLRKGRKGDVVVINHHKASSAHDEPRSSDRR